MPYLISTPENWFRTQKRDLHLICARNTQGRFSKRKYAEAQKLLHAWFSDNLPHTSINIVGPSEYSGWIEGGPNYLTADLGKSDIAIFNTSWGNDSFWKIETWPFLDWRMRVESTNPLPSPALGFLKTFSNCGDVLQQVLWWDTPRGILLLDAYSCGTFVGLESGEQPLGLKDGWWRIQQLFPEFYDDKAETFPSGYYRIWKTGQSVLMVEWVFLADWDSEEYANNAHNIQHLMDAIGISESPSLEIIVGDF